MDRILEISAKYYSRLGLRVILHRVGEGGLAILTGRYRRKGSTHPKSLTLLNPSFSHWLHNWPQGYERIKAAMISAKMPTEVLYKVRRSDKGH